MFMHYHDHVPALAPCTEDMFPVHPMHLNNLRIGCLPVAIEGQFQSPRVLQYQFISRDNSFKFLTLSEEKMVDNFTMNSMGQALCLTVLSGIRQFFLALPTRKNIALFQKWEVRTARQGGKARYEYRSS